MDSTTVTEAMEAAARILAEHEGDEPSGDVLLHLLAYTYAKGMSAGIAECADALAKLGAA